LVHHGPAGASCPGPVSSTRALVDPLGPLRASGGRRRRLRRREIAPLRSGDPRASAPLRMPAPHAARHRVLVRSGTSAPSGADLRQAHECVPSATPSSARPSST
jgi:hypothetical protein